MSLSLIGAGFGRTGTLSLKSALEALGLGRCYHMMEVFGNPSHVDVWSDAVAGRPVDWDVLFEGYGATVDWPAAHFWRELSDHYPGAKVLLSVRDPERWYDSVRNTIYQVMVRDVSDAPEFARRHQAMVRKMILEDTFGGRFEDRAHAIDVFRRHTAAVREAIAPERLLVFDAAEGWEPLCRFLGRPVPDAPFPRVNTTDEFLTRFSPPSP